jgi:hypothetical protein
VVTDIVGVKSADERATVGLEPDPALAVQSDDGLANRYPTDAELRRDFVLPDPIAFAQLPSHDRLPYLGGYLVSATLTMEPRAPEP